MAKFDALEKYEKIIDRHSEELNIFYKEIEDENSAFSATLYFYTDEEFTLTLSNVGKIIKVLL